MRNDAGDSYASRYPMRTPEKLGIPYMTDVMNEASEAFPVLGKLSPYDIPYDEKSAFSITVNHRKTFTGITDNDRALTIRELADICRDGRHSEFGDLFRSPAM